MTYTQLKADIADYLHRTDLTDKIPGFIRLAEAALLREFAPTETEVSAAITTVSHYATLPADFGQLSKIMRDDVLLTSSDYRIELGKLWLEDDETVTLFYVPTIPALSDTVATNWLLDNGADLYLYASALEGAKYLRNAEQVATLFDLVGRTIAAIKSKSVARAIASRGILQIRRA